MNLNELDLLNLLRNNETYRSDFLTALGLKEDETETSVKTSSLTLDALPERNPKKEKVVIDDILDNFDFDAVMFFASIAPFISEDYAYYRDIEHFRDKEALKTIARNLLADAFDGLYEHPIFMIDNDCSYKTARYSIGGVFNVDVFVDLEDGSIDGKMEYNLSEWTTY